MTHVATEPLTDTDVDGRDGRRIHSDAAWASARDAYLSGEAGASVAARHGISSSAFWRRAAEEGWRRCDQPTPPPPPFDPDRPALDEAAQLALADKRMSWALERGDVTEALRWQKMQERIEGREARRRETEARVRRDAERRAHAEIAALTDTARDVERVARAGLAQIETELRLNRLKDRASMRDSRESKNADPAPDALLDPAAPGLSRAERRRRQKYLAKHGPAPPD